AGGKTWHAYLSSSTNAANPGAPVNARDRIGRGPWQNAKGVGVATSVDDLHSDANKINKESGLTEKGEVVKGVGDTPNQHDMLTGSGMDGKALPGNVNLTCNNWTSSQHGSAIVGHVDRIASRSDLFPPGRGETNKREEAPCGHQLCSEFSDLRSSPRPSRRLRPSPAP